MSEPQLTKVAFGIFLDKKALLYGVTLDPLKARPTIRLTDVPAVVDLKREFRRLDEREQQIKADLAAVRDRKQTIAREIFAGH